VKLHKVQIKRIIGPTPNGAAILLGNEEKTFVIFVGFFESAALIREINGESPARPLTHELIQNICLGFDIEVKQIVISTIIENTFCATLMLQQRVREDADGSVWSGRRNEVRIDARPSDCLVLALKNKIDILVTDEVFGQVQDVSKMAQDVESSLAGMMAGAELGEYRPEDVLSESRPGSLESESFLDLEEFGVSPSADEDDEDDDDADADADEDDEDDDEDDEDEDEENDEDENDEDGDTDYENFGGFKP